MSVLRERLGEAVSGAATPLAAADRLCEACVELLDVDGASISMIKDGATQGTFGSSGELSRTLDELQFTYGQGPCLDAVATNRPVSADDLDGASISMIKDGATQGTFGSSGELSRTLDELQFTYGQGPCLDAVATNRPVSAEDLDGPLEDRWPGLAEQFLGHGVRAIYALPVTVASTPIGALDLFRHRSGPLDGDALTGGLWAAGLASLPLLDLMNGDTDWQAAGDGAGAFDQLASLERVEVYQATGMIVAALEVTAADAVSLLRGHAVANDLTASEAAYRVLGRRILLVDGELRPAGGGQQR